MTCPCHIALKQKLPSRWYWSDVVCPLTFLCRILAASSLGAHFSSTSAFGCGKAQTMNKETSILGSEVIRNRPKKSCTQAALALIWRQGHQSPNVDCAEMENIDKENTLFAHSDRHRQSIYMTALSSSQAKHYIPLSCRCQCCFYSNVLPSSTAVTTYFI